MKRPVVFLFSLFVAFSGCKKPTQQAFEFDSIANADYEWKPLPGRAIRPDIIEFVVYPERFNEKRIVLEGTWNVGFETSEFRVDNSEQKFYIWTEWDSEPMAKEEPDKVAEIEEVLRSSGKNGWWNSVRIVAEGSFFYGENSQFEHMSGSQGRFVIDRIFQISAAPADGSRNQADDSGALAP